MNFKSSHHHLMPILLTDSFVNLVGISARREQIPELEFWFYFIDSQHVNNFFRELICTLKI